MDLRPNSLRPHILPFNPTHPAESTLGVTRRDETGVEFFYIDLSRGPFCIFPERAVVMEVWRDQHLARAAQRPGGLRTG